MDRKILPCNNCKITQAPEVPESTQNIEGDLRDLMPTSQEAYDGWGGCWPGDGSGMDDFEDWNQQEGWDM
tara:strand:- start:517 stop:726 length:210 start_codon:yes stop_codon:yes gene_type:complete